jgi:protease-4
MRSSRALMMVSLVAVAIGGCDTRRGTGFAEPKAADPWAGGGAAGTATAEAGGGGGLFGGGGGGLEQMVKTIVENLKKPGPYEAPDHGAAYKADDKHFGVITMSGGVTERTSYSFSLFGGADMGGAELRQLIARFEKLAKDDKLEGLVVRFEDLGISTPDAIELRAALHAFRHSGKRLACFTEGVSNVSYLVLAACDRIALAPIGSVVLSGPAAMPIHLKPLLDSVGVKADFINIGAYKGAAEPLTRDAPSPQMLEVLGDILDRNYQTTLEIVAAERKLAPDQVKAIIDEAMYMDDAALAAKLVDEVTTWEQFLDTTAGARWNKLELDPEDDGGDLGQMVKAMQFVGMSPPTRPSGPHVAVVYAIGNIIDGEGAGLIGARGEIASGTLVPALRALGADDDVKAIVLRVDSGGGSAQASELIWSTLAEIKAKKPVIVSMSDVAASGGYYISAGATKIFAQPDTLTGSIGVIGGKLAIGGGLDKFGVKTYPIGRGKRATMFASLGAWTPDERAAIERHMRAVYDRFKGRVAAGRGKTPEQVEPIAQGHVWTGAKAKELGLVDELGGLDAAIAKAQELAQVPATASVEVYPPDPTLRDFLRGFDGGSGPLGVLAPLEAALGHMRPALAAQVRGMIAALATFDDEPVQTRVFLPPMIQ